jgi:hypothetical protein
MRFASYLASAVVAATAMVSTSAFAGAINLAPGTIVTTETSWETNTSAVNQVLQGVVTVASINEFGAAVNPVYLSGSGGQYLSAVFDGFILRDVSLSGNSFQLSYTGGNIKYYTSTTNPFATIPGILNSSFAVASAAVAAGTPWVGFNAETVDAFNDTLIITGVQQGSGFNLVTSSGTNTVYLKLIQGFGIPGMIQQNGFTNPWLNQLADATYQGSANTLQCAQYGIDPNSPFKICGSNNLSTNIVPEPFTLSLFGAGLAGMVALGRRKAKKAA